MSGDLLYSSQNGLARIIISQPEKMNAMAFHMWSALPGLIARASADPAIRAIVLEGAGEKSFCSGADISQFGEKRSDPDAVAAYDTAVADGMRALAGASKPTVAVIRGICFGGGFGLALACDIRLARSDARFRVPAARLGLGYGYEGVTLIARKLGPDATADILFSARILDAAEALRLGVVGQVWGMETFAADSAAYLDLMGANAPLTLMAAKRALIELARPEAERTPEQVADLVTACFASADYREGQAAFKEKRQPQFTGA
ncbi:enoyl-CoA hydratase [Azorhizobium oxalatiphilum]|uniref:Enoyl-CoA hydratase n=1 Tax=Azorhizobium oxalatiphilum TaxID=980631 RepID=A0A917BY50_9HYPH|nr:enoyl-CoA hydratase [Azorhizobium oxalatiphilum]GGF63216.1 enoyl-CoA hydratase [Azorhizobium oxalatiphilum]